MGITLMSEKESDRAAVLSQVKDGRISLSKASEILDLSYTQTKRLWSKFKKFGPKGLISKKRGRPSNRAVPECRRQEMVQIIVVKYYDCKPLFISEKLSENHGFHYSPEFIRQLMIEHKLWIPSSARLMFINGVRGKNLKVNYHRRMHQNMIGLKDEVQSAIFIL